MGYDYALVHLTYTIPPAVLLSALYYPLCTKLDLYKIAFLITIAVVSTIPWDSYLIKTGVWSYPENVIIGPKLLEIPLEEVFFFVIQTYDTTLLYLLLSKPTLHPTYLVKEARNDRWKWIKVLGQLGLALGITNGLKFVRAEGERTYLGLIMIWALPFLLLLWSLAYQLLVNLPSTNTVLPIALPTLYLWVVDTLALKRGTWVIEHGTKTGLELWSGLELEEAIFFLLTNCLIVFGLVAFDNAMAILHIFPAHFPSVPSVPSPLLLIRALILPSAAYDDDRIIGLQQAVDRLQAKSRSFYLASSTFQGRLRIDLILLYSFCRVADDLIDNASSVPEAREWLSKLQTHLDHAYSPAKPNPKNPSSPALSATDLNRGPATLYALQAFPPSCHLTLLLLPTQHLSKTPLDDLLRGFAMDLDFTNFGNTPIRNEADLDLYASRVAGTVALLCIQLVLHHYPGTPKTTAQALTKAGHDMGVALQYTNIARDLSVDATLDRCYLPPSWLKKEKLTMETFIKNLQTANTLVDPNDKKFPDAFFFQKVSTLRSRLLDRSFGFYRDSVAAIESLPPPARAPMRVAVESYMQIARELRKKDSSEGKGGSRGAMGSNGSGLGGLWAKVFGRRNGAGGLQGRATVPAWRRVWVAWRALRGPVEGQEVGEGGK
ncbi:hypothetical protein MBLNU230_g6745t1 [Neophaeotheca triangularis]